MLGLDSDYHKIIIHHECQYKIGKSHPRGIPGAVPVVSVSASQAAVQRLILVSSTFFRGKNNFPLPLIQDEQSCQLLAKE